MQRGREGDRERGRHGITVSWQALIISLPTAVSGSLFFALRSPGVYAWGGGPKHPFSFPVFPLQGTLCVQSPEERPLKGPKEKGKEFFCCPCDPAVNGWATKRRKRACPASIWQPYDQGLAASIVFSCNWARHWSRIPTDETPRPIHPRKDENHRTKVAAKL